MKEKNTVRALLVVLRVFLMAVGILLFAQWFLTMANTIRNSVYSYPYSVWSCEEADIQLVMDGKQVCYGMAGEDILYFEFRFSRGRGAKRNFEIYSAGCSSIEEAVTMDAGQFELVYQGKLKRCDELGFSFRINRQDLPMLGLTEPKTLCFVRKNIPYEADFSELNNPVFQEFAGK